MSSLCSRRKIHPLDLAPYILLVERCQNQSALWERAVAVFVNESLHSEMLKEMMEGSQIQGVGFEAEEMGWAGAVGGAEVWDGPVGRISHAGSNFTLQVVFRPHRKSCKKLGAISQIIDVPVEVLPQSSMPFDSPGQILHARANINIIAATEFDLAKTTHRHFFI